MYMNENGMMPISMITCYLTTYSGTAGPTECSSREATVGGQNPLNVLIEQKSTNYDSYESDSFGEEMDDYDKHDDETIFEGISNHNKYSVAPDLSSDYDYYDGNDLSPKSIHSELSEVVGKRVGTDMADSILESNLRSNKVRYCLDICYKKNRTDLTFSCYTT